MKYRLIVQGWERERVIPYQSEDPGRTIATHRMKEEKGKTVGYRKGASSHALETRREHHGIRLHQDRSTEILTWK